jgi:flagellar basal-body rod protein FlgF
MEARVVRGLFTGASGMIVQMDRLDAVANNLANVDLTGYKKDTAVTKAFPELLIRRFNDNGVHVFPMGSADSAPVVGTLGTGVELNEVFTVFDQGPLKRTENNFDLALENKGFLTVLTPQGERLTRNGAFLVNPDGFLVTEGGDFVLGDNGTVRLSMNDFIVTQDGTIYQTDAFFEGAIERIDRLRIVNVREPRYLQKVGNSYWRTTEDSGEAEVVEGSARPIVRQGFLEGSNVNAVREMVDMIEVNRAYDANQKTVQTEDSLMGKLFNEVMRV